MIVLTTDQKHIHRTRLTIEDDVELLELMGEWTHNTDDCHRWIISKTMDGLPVTCANLAGAEPCDICQLASDLHTVFEQAKKSAEKPKSAIMPMEDIQGLVASEPSGQTWDDDMDNMEFENDDLIAQLDLSTININGEASLPRLNKPTNRTLDLGAHRNAVSIQASQLQPMSAKAIRVVQNVGMNVKVAGSSNLQMQERKQQKSNTLDELGVTLRGHCAICWT